MKTQLNQILTILFCTLLVSCSTSNNNENKSAEVQEIEEEAKKDISELTYSDVVDLVFQDEGEGIEWHGEEIANTLAQSVVISSEGVCGEEDCGTAMYMTSIDSTKSIEVIMKAAYNIEGDIGYMARKYNLAPDQKLALGCSHLCYNSKSYLFDRMVVGTAYIEE